MKILHTIFIPIFGLTPLYNSANAQTVAVTFQVNMSYQIDQGNFNPSSEFVDVAGTFNGWGSQITQLSDLDGDEIYEVTVGGIIVSGIIEYKFRFNGQWDGREEFPGVGNNRTYTIQPDSNTIYVWYNDRISPFGPPSADFGANSLTLYENGLVHFEDLSSGTIDGWLWNFEGGAPTTSTEQNPIVRYPQAGSYDVTLIVSNDTDRDTLDLFDFILVLERDMSDTFWWNNSIFYELFVRSFYDSDGDGIGDFKGIIEKLDYLNDGDPNTDVDLGITGIWLMPIHQSPSYHGYDVIDYRSVNSDYGSMDDFREFLDEAHNRGIRVIIDFVLNHSSKQHPWFQQSAQNNPDFREFYRWSAYNPGYLGPWGQQVWHYYLSGYYYGVFWEGMPDLNYEEPAVKDSMFDAADFWLEDVGVDGFRLDAVLYIWEDGTQLANTPATYQFLGDFDQHIKQTKPDAFAVGEAWTNTEQVLNYVNDDRLDYCFEFDLAWATLNAVNTADARGLAAQMQKVHNLYPHLQYGTFLTNHDQNRVMNEFQNDLNKAKIAASLYLTFPGIPYIYYGEEIGMVGAKPDEFIRTPMQWSGTPNSGFTTGAPWIRVNSNYMTFNVAKEQADHFSLLNWYKKLIAIRNRTAALRLGDYEGIECSAHSVMTFFRHYQDESILVLVNTDSEPKSNITLSLFGSSINPGTYSLASLLDSSDSLTIHLDASYEIQNVSIDGYETLIYSFFDSTTTDVGLDTRPTEDYYLLQNFPNPFNPTSKISYYIPRPGLVTLKIYNILGEEIMTLVDEFQRADSYSIEFHAEDMTSGVYLYRLQIQNRFSTTKKMVVLR